MHYLFKKPSPLQSYDEIGEIICKVGMGWQREEFAWYSVELFVLYENTAETKQVPMLVAARSKA
jgi:hypothetical protein